MIIIRKVCIFNSSPQFQYQFAAMKLLRTKCRSAMTIMRIIRSSSFISQFQFQFAVPVRNAEINYRNNSMDNNENSSQFQFKFAVPVRVRSSSSNLCKDRFKTTPRDSPSYPKLIRNRPRGLPETLQGTQEPTRHHLEPSVCAPEHSQGDPGMLGESPGVLRGAKKNA